MTIRDNAIRDRGTGNTGTSRRRKKLLILPISLISILALACAIYLSVPTAEFLPSDGNSSIALGKAIEVHASPLAEVGKIAVYANGKLVDLEYNLGEGDLTRELELEPGQTVRVEAKVVSPIGVTRELSATFDTVKPLVVDNIASNGEDLAANQMIAPDSTLAFSFNKPVSQAMVSIDGGDSIDLRMDESNQSQAVLEPSFALKQGMSHTIKLMATAGDTADFEEEMSFRVVKPLSFYGKVESDGNGGIVVNINSSVPFSNPESLQKFISTDLPDAVISVENQKIIVRCSSPSTSQKYSVELASATGIDGSFLEAPLKLNLEMKGGQTRVTTTSTTQGTEGGGSSTSSSGYNNAGSGSGASSGSSSASSSSQDSGGPPPGWPPCCPWPPQ